MLLINVTESIAAEAASYNEAETLRRPAKPASAGTRPS
jgi:hypothetical protein